MYSCIPITICTIVWRIIYNLKYIKFFDGNITWFNNIIFYILYSLGSSTLCTIVRDKNDPNYIYIVCAEVYSAFIMGFGSFLLVLFWFEPYGLVLGAPRRLGEDTKETQRLYITNIMILEVLDAVV